MVAAVGVPSKRPAVAATATPSLPERVYNYFATPQWDLPFLLSLLLMESVLCVVIIRFVSYTEIDWEAYMQEVETYLGGEYDYLKIRGGTGPLVYPAGFLYFFAVLRSWTQNGNDILAAQYIFAVFYIITMALVLSLYHTILQQLRRQQGRGRNHKSTTSSPHAVWCIRVAMMLCCLSKRLHSIYVLRLFNDGVAMLLLYASVICFVRCRSNQWMIAAGCFIFSLAVSIKMNILLFAPGLLLLLLQVHPSLWGTFWSLAICGVTQVILGAPFLLRYPVSYLRKAFELDRVFFYIWTVNWKFLPEDIFVSKKLSLLLLLLHLGTLGLFAIQLLRLAKSQVGRRICWPNDTRISPEYVAYVLFLSNFVGICFARTLHYQFYCWYISSIPLLLLLSRDTSIMTNTKALSTIMTLGIVMVSLELAFHIFPAKPWSSALLQVTHFFVLIPCILKPPSFSLVAMLPEEDPKQMKEE